MPISRQNIAVHTRIDSTGSSVLPGASSQTAFLSFDNTVSGINGTPAGTFTRAGGAINPETGLWANENLLLQSNAFTTTWAAAGGTLTLSQNQVDPFGTANSAWSATDDNAAALEYVQQVVTLTAVPHTASVFIKKTSGAQTAYPLLMMNSATHIAAVTIDTTNGVLTPWTAYTGYTVITPTVAVVNYSTDYWRVSITFTASATSWTAYIMPAGAPAANTSTGTPDASLTGTHVFYGAQLQRGTTAGTYLPTTSAAVYSTPRYSTTAKQGTSLLVEESTTNSILQSSTYNTTWTAFGTTFPSTNNTNPFGVADAYLLQFTGTSIPRIAQAVVFAGNASATISFWAKRGTANYVRLTTNDNIGWNTGISSKFTLTDSWQRFSFSGDLLPASVGSTVNVMIGTADATSAYDADCAGNVYIWGVQLEALPYPTSYIPTLAASVTRAAESVSYSTTGVVAAPATIEGWFQFKGVFAGKYQTLWSSYTAAADYTSIKWNGVVLYAEKAKTGQVTEYVTITPSPALTANTWHHVALTINADGTMGLYLDGVADLKTAGTDADGLGAELITAQADREFSSDTGYWTKAAGVTIGSNVASSDGTTGSAYILYRNASEGTAYKAYQVLSDVSRTSGTLKVYSGATLFNTITASASGIKSVGVANTTASPRFLSDSPTFIGTIDNVSWKEIYNNTSTAFVPVIASTMQVGSYNSTLQANGLLDNWRFFNKVLTASEISAYYNRGK